MSEQMVDMTNVKVGDVFAFKGYAELPEGMEPRFKPGQKIKLAAAPDNPEDNGYMFLPVEADDQPEENLYPDEFTALPAEAPAKPARTRKAKAAAAPAAEPETEQAEQAAAPSLPARSKKAKAAAEPKAKAPKAKAKAKAEKAPKVKAEKPAKPKTALTKGVVEFMADQTPDEAAVALADALDKLEREEGTTAFMLGGVLTSIAETGDIPGFESFDEFIKGKLTFGRRKAYYLMSQYRLCVSVGLTEEDVERVGWTKLRVVAPKLANLTKAEQRKLLAKAEKSTREDLEAEIKTGRTSSGDKATPVTRFKFSLHADQAEVARKAMAKAQSLTEGGDANGAFFLILTEWVQTHADVDVPLDTALEAIETKYGVKVMVTEEGSAED